MRVTLTRAISRPLAMTALKLIALWLLVIVGVSAAAEMPASIVIPPPPSRPATDGLPREQQEAISQKFRADYVAWENSLTPEQRTERKRLQDEAARQRRVEIERRRRLPLATDGYTWQQEAANRKLAPDIVERLTRDKIAYGSTVKQSFTPYFSGPIFVTSDSLLNGFHVLFEDAFRDLELRQVARLRATLETVLTQARKNLANSSFPLRDVSPGWQHAQLVIGVALNLLGGPLDLVDPEVRGEIQTQIAKIKSAEAVELPAWLGAPTAKLRALDYRRCKPVGFYAQDEKLSDYFRAVRWLQLIPFRLDRDVELAAIGLLGYGTAETWGETNVAGQLRIYCDVLGDADTPGLPEAAIQFQHFFLGAPNGVWADLLLQKRLAALSRRRVLLGERSAEPSSIALSNRDREILAGMEFQILPPALLPDIRLFQKLADQNLLPEGLAVAAMLGSEFARRHLSRITAEQLDATLTHMNAPAPGGRTREGPSLYDDYLDVLRTLLSPPASDAPSFMSGDAWQTKSQQTLLSGWAQMRHTFTLQTHLSVTYFGITHAPPGFVEPNPEFFSRFADLVERARGLLDGKRSRWDELASVTRKLEALAHKQLRQQPWSAADENFLRSYGAKLGFVMGYESDSTMAPRDDAPRWAEVHHHAERDVSLAAAIGRPRLIHVLYPWNGLEILCTGSVLPYYEYESKERLTDAEWQTLLDSPQAPAPPEWLRPFVAK